MDRAAEQEAAQLAAVRGWEVAEGVAAVVVEAVADLDLEVVQDLVLLAQNSP